jgi:hypothetical protein
MSAVYFATLPALDFWNNTVFNNSNTPSDPVGTLAVLSAVLVQGTNAVLRESSFSGNRAYGGGGAALAVRLSSEVGLILCTFTDNAVLPYDGQDSKDSFWPDLSGGASCSSLHGCPCSAQEQCTGLTCQPLSSSGC